MIKLNEKKLLGFRMAGLVASTDGRQQTGAKIGLKIGAKAGATTGVKIVRL